MILKFKKYVFLRIFFHFIYILAIAGVPVVIRYMIDSTYSNGIYDILKFISFFIGLIFVGMLSQYISQKSSWKLEREFNLYLRKKLFSVIISKEPYDFNKNTISDYNSKFISIKKEL